ncbi:MAG: nucleotide-binding protein [Methylocella sp.]
MCDAVERIKPRIADLEAFDPSSLTRHDDPRVIALEKAIEETLQRAFGADTIEFDRYARAASLRPRIGVTVLSLSAGKGRPPSGELQREFSEAKEKSIALLGQAVKGLQEEIVRKGSSSLPPVLATPQKETAGRQVFIVHGHNGEAREAVSSFLRKIDFTPVILHEQSNRGRTVIEKFEAHADVAFAVVLLTPDDIGGPKDGALLPRARQNVILELGYFIGKLGRKNVCAIKHGDVELPSDIFGVVWTPFDAYGAWTMALAKELKAAGHAIDWDKVVGP